MKWDKKEISLKQSKMISAILMLLFGVFLFILIFGSVHQKKVGIKEGTLASETIRANKTIENKYETESKRELAAEAVQPEYNYSSEIATDQVKRLETLFQLIEDVNKEADADYKNRNSKAKSGESIPKPTIAEKVASLKSKFEKVDTNDISFYQGFPVAFYQGIFELTNDEVAAIEKSTIEIVSSAMKDHIRTNNLTEVKDAGESKIDYLDFPAKQKQLIKYAVDQGIVVNEIYDQKKTEEQKTTAKNNVAPIMIYQGEIIVREGVQIDQKAMQKLELLGLTDTKTSIFPIIALIMLIILQLLVLSFVGFQTSNHKARLRYLIFYVSMMTISILVMKFLQIFQSEELASVPLLFPAAFAPLVLNLFISRRTGIMSAVFQIAFSLFVYYSAIGTSSILLICVSYGFTGIMSTLVKRRRIGEQLGLAMLWLIVFPLFFIVILVIYQGMSLQDSSTWTNLFCAIASCVLSFLLSVGLHPYIELVLNDDSMIVLNELSNPNHPLLKKLLEEAPGTYHHSMMVANLSANAVAEIGGRSLLTRVACYYHDIGKIKHANFFVENLPDGAENPHNFLLPEDSKEIIFGHVTEGAKILENEHMPQMVIDICRQHHGKTLMKYFYVKAKERNSEVTEEEFRYPGPKPQTKEAAIVNIADSSEAAVRAMDHPTNQKIKDFVHNLIVSRIEDGQFDECNLTMREMNIAERSIVNGLCSSFHSRIKYPKMKSEAEKMKSEQEESV